MVFKEWGRDEERIIIGLTLEVPKRQRGEATRREATRGDGGRHVEKNRRSWVPP
jgi:hypothetical protein